VAADLAGDHVQPQQPAVFRAAALRAAAAAALRAAAAAAAAPGHAANHALVDARREVESVARVPAAARRAQHAHLKQRAVRLARPAAAAAAAAALQRRAAHHLRHALLHVPARL
jgi:hypothetical protein